MRGLKVLIKAYHNEIGSNSRSSRPSLAQATPEEGMASPDEHS